MSGVYAYCVVPAGVAPPAGLTGVDDAALVVHDADALGVWFSRHEQRPTPDIVRVRQHNAVVSAPFGLGVTPVPFRFGQWLDDEQAIADRIRRHGERWRTRLTELAATCELGIRIRWPRSEPAARDVTGPARSGRAYLERVARNHARKAELRAHADRLGEALRSAAGDLLIRERIDAGGAVTLVVAHLVRTADVAAHATAIDRVRQEHPELEIVLTGPWPPYSFVT
jgi:hypothetical protein